MTNTVNSLLDRSFIFFWLMLPVRNFDWNEWGGILERSIQALASNTSMHMSDTSVQHLCRLPDYLTITNAPMCCSPRIVTARNSPHNYKLCFVHMYRTCTTVCVRIKQTRQNVPFIKKVLKMIKGHSKRLGAEDY